MIIFHINPDMIKPIAKYFIFFFLLFHQIPQLLSGLMTATKESEDGQQASQKTAAVEQEIAEPEFKEVMKIF